MASPTVASNPAAAMTTNSEQRARMIRKKKKKTNHQSAKQALTTSDQQQQQLLYGNSWKSQTQQQIYSSKLLKALRHVTGSGAATSSSAAPAPRRGREVREAAERALAATAKGRSRWSRAILTPSSRLKLNYLRKRNNRPRTSSALASVTGSSRSKKPRVSVYRLKGKSLPAVQRKARVLGRLVPGCRKQPVPVILDETIDYIEAKLMQIRAMTDLIHRLNGSFSASASASASAPSPPT